MALGQDVVGELDDVDVHRASTYESVSLSFGTSRTPQSDHATFAFITVTTYSTGGSEGRVEVEVDQGNGFTTRSVFATMTSSGALTDPPDASDTETQIVYVPEGASYRVTNVTDPNGSNSLDSIAEVKM